MRARRMAVRSRLKLLLAERNLERIKRGEPELTSREIAANSGVPASVIWGLTSGRAGRIDFKTIDKLCKFLQIQPGELFEFVLDQETGASGRDD